ncbi:MAG: hypothetical protein ACOC71_06665 [Hyphomicrobiales bacterium]
MPEQFNTKYLAGQGRVYVSPRDAAGEPTGYQYAGDIESLTLSPNVSRTEIVENETGGRAIGASFFTQVNYTLAMANRSIRPDHLALILQGTENPFAAGSVTDESHTAQQNRFIRLARQNVSNVVVTDGDATTYDEYDPEAETGDYIVHAAAGLVEIVDTGAISDDDPLEIDYDFEAQSRVPANPQNTPVSLLFAGVNMANNERIRCEIYKCKLDPGSFDLVNAEGASAQRNGVVELDTLRSDGDQLFNWIVT